MVHFFCPNCWREIGESNLQCPYCGFELSKFTELSYEQKLLIALRHPVKEIRRSVVFIVGEKKLEESVEFLEKIVDEEEDPIVLIEVAKALEKINTEKSEKVLEKMRAHRFPIISRYMQARED